MFAQDKGHSYQPWNGRSPSLIWVKRKDLTLSKKTEAYTILHLESESKSHYGGCWLLLNPLPLRKLSYN